MLERLHLWDETKIPWPQPSNHDGYIICVWGYLLVGRLAPWSHSSATQDLEQALEEYVECKYELQKYLGSQHIRERSLCHRLRKSLTFQPLIDKVPWKDITLYQKLKEKYTRLIHCSEQYTRAYSYRKISRWGVQHLGLDDIATVSQWNLRSQLAAQSSECAYRWPPLRSNRYYVTFPSRVKECIITRTPSLPSKFSPSPYGLRDDHWVPNIEWNNPFPEPEPETDSDSDCSSLTSPPRYSP
ncbi:hypothetical protein BDP27DRAFT_1323769 [Rhodocollybia butyracea]|uniref:Uncharacterized protein n=1 Tax=Rhodocollybia butyracea TaxID=206335 RepID=A0A9P5PQU6_9AGAR|nr:hypothetical protein BDP27DRAFT_1323769 [Rhodocollybia butyracea]